MIERPKTFDQLATLILNVLPIAEFGEDHDGQVVVYTNLYQKPGKRDQLCLFEELEALEKGGTK